MNSQIDPTNSRRATSSGVFDYLSEQGAEALELKVRSEAMAERRLHDPSQKRVLIGLISCLLPIPDLMHPVFD